MQAADNWWAERFYASGNHCITRCTNEVTARELQGEVSGVRATILMI